MFKLVELIKQLIKAEQEDTLGEVTEFSTKQKQIIELKKPYEFSIKKLLSSAKNDPSLG